MDFRLSDCSSITLLSTVFTTFTLWHSSALAQDSDQPMEIIEVKAQNQYQSMNIEVLQRKDFINSAQTLADILKSINGIQIRQISGIGNPASVSIRGSTSKQVKLYIDGQLVNDGQFGGFDLNQLPTEYIQSIEISKNQAIGTGSTPIGGVIRINTYDPKQDKTRLSAAIGSFGYGELNLIHNQVLNRHNLSFGASSLTSDNNHNFLVPQSFDDPSTSIVEPLRNNQFKKHSLFVNNESQWQQHQGRLNIQYAKQQKSIANYQNNSPQNDSRLDSEIWRYSYQHNWQSNQDWIEQIELEAYHQDKSEQYHHQPGGPIHRFGDYDNAKSTLSFKPYLQFEPLNITPFIEYSSQQFESVTTVNGQTPPCNAISPCDIKAQQEQLNFGSRFQWQSADPAFNSYLLISQVKERNDNVAVNDPNAQTLKKDNDYHTQELGVNYQHQWLDAQLSFSNGVRTPTLFEMFGDRGTFKGNDNLEAEKAKTLSIGLKHQSEQYSLTGSVYQQQQDNAIVAIFNSSGIGSYDNVSDTKLTGMELQGHYRFSPSLTVNLQANLINSSTTSEIVAFDDKKLPGIFHRQYSIGVDYQFDQNWRLNIQTRADRQLYFNRANRFESDHHVGNGNPANRVLTDLNLHWQLNRINASVAIKNLLDQSYQDLANRPAQGRSIQLKISIEDL